MKSLVSVFVCLLAVVATAHRVSNFPSESKPLLSSSSALISNEKSVNSGVNKNGDSNKFDNKGLSSNVIWRDNSETRRLGYDRRNATITKVVYHGIYPALNITVPVGGQRTNQTGWKPRVRQKRSRTGRNVPGAIGSGESPQYQSVERYDVPQRQPSYKEQDDQIRFLVERTSSMRSQNYARARHAPNVNASFYSVPKSSSSTVNELKDHVPKYRTLYFPATSSSARFTGDPSNKGRVKLISAAYYNVNGSNDNVRSYQNDRPKRINSFQLREKRDLSESWQKLGDWLRQIGSGKKDEPNEYDSFPLASQLPREENKSLPTHYGYSTIGHGHRRNFIPVDPKTEEPSISVSGVSEEEGSATPRSGTVLINAPERGIFCRPPKKLARGRCRTVWWADRDTASK